MVRAQLAATRFEERARAVAAILARERVDLVGPPGDVPLDTTPPDGEEQVLVDFLPTLLAELDAAGAPYDAHAVNPNFGGACRSTARACSRCRRERHAGAPWRPGRRRRRGHRDVRRGARRPHRHRRRHVPGVRGWGRVDVRVAGRPVRFVNTHTEAYDGPVRDAQRDEVLAANATPTHRWSWWATSTPPAGRGRRARRLDGRLDPGRGDGFTCGQAADLANEVSALRERIDYVWVRGAGVLGARPSATCRVTAPPRTRCGPRTTPASWPTWTLAERTRSSR